jgi:glycosyltransferase involved in cell wall biosynthesis
LCTGLPPEAWLLQHGPAREAVRALQRETSFALVFAERWTWGRDALGAAPFAVLDAGELLAGHAQDAARASRNPLVAMLRRHWARGMARFERAVVADAGLVLTENPGDRQLVRAWRGDRAAVVLPSGLCTRYFVPRRAEVDPSNVLFFASLGDPERRDALLRLQRDFMPLVRQHLRHAHLTVVGEDPIPELGDAVHDDPWLRFTGPLEDERVELWRGAVAALPLRFGSPPRVRLAQLLAMGIPVVTTPEAAHGLDLRSGDGLLIVPDGGEFATTLAQVLLDSSLREDLSRRGREMAQKRLSIAATYDRMSARLASQDPTL